MCKKHARLTLLPSSYQVFLDNQHTYTPYVNTGDGEHTTTMRAHSLIAILSSSSAYTFALISSFAMRAYHTPHSRRLSLSSPIHTPLPRGGHMHAIYTSYHPRGISHIPESLIPKELPAFQTTITHPFQPRAIPLDICQRKKAYAQVRPTRDSKPQYRVVCHTLSFLYSQIYQLLLLSPSSSLQHKQGHSSLEHRMHTQHSTLSSLS